MSKPSDGAMRAAKEISREGYDGSDYGNVDPWKEQDFADVATIIDRETGYPELFYAIEMLEEIVTGEVVHLYRGNCPEPGAEKERDEDCPACLRLRAADSLIAKAKGEDQ